MLEIHLNPGDSAPVYRQIIRQVRCLLASGRLQPGDEMPSVRVLARELLVNPNTVARAYRDLEAMGVLVSRQGSGSCVSAADTPGAESPIAHRQKLMRLAAPADVLLGESRKLGVPLDEVQEFLIERDAALDAEKTA